MQKLNDLKQEGNEDIYVSTINSVRKRNWIRFSLVVIIWGIVILVIISIFVTVSDECKLREQLDLGVKYLEEMNYEQAIMQYKLVLEIDIQNKEALTKISEVYSLSAEIEMEYIERMEAYNMAIEYALLVYQYYPEDVTLQRMLVNTYMNAGEYCLRTEKFDDAERYYIEVRKWGEKFSIMDELSQIEGKMIEIEQAKRIQEEKERNERLLKPLYDAYLTGNMDKVRELSRDKALMNVEVTLENGKDSIYFGEEDVNGNRNGLGVAMYSQHFFYLGEWKNGAREGNGFWLCNYESDDYWANYSYIYECSWKEDKPNGWMVMDGYYYYEKELMEEHEYRDIYVEGNVIDGLFDGKMVEVWEGKNGEVKTWPICYKNGIVEVVKRNGSDNVVAYANEDGDWLIYSDEQILYPCGMLGFVE